MTQRLFNKDNEKDMQDLWDILPEKTAKITGGNNLPIYLFDSNNELFNALPMGLFKINWCGVEEITRPMDYKSMIGCVGWFWDDEQDKEHKRLGILTGMEEGYFCDERVSRWGNFSPAKKSELKFWGEAKDE